MEPMKPYRRGWNGRFELECRSADGRLLWEEAIENTLGAGGQQQLLASNFNGGVVPASYYLRLYQNSLAAGVSDPAPDATLANLTGEISGGGYAPVALAPNTTDWPTLIYELDTVTPANSGWRLRSRSVALGPVGANWGPFNYIVLATTTGSAGGIIAFARTTQERILLDGQSLPVVYNIKIV